MKLSSPRLERRRSGRGKAREILGAPQEAELLFEPMRDLDPALVEGWFKELDKLKKDVRRSLINFHQYGRLAQALSFLFPEQESKWGVDQALFERFQAEIVEVQPWWDQRPTGLGEWYSTLESYTQLIFLAPDRIPELIGSDAPWKINPRRKMQHVSMVANARANFAHGLFSQGAFTLGHLFPDIRPHLTQLVMKELPTHLALMDNLLGWDSYAYDALLVPGIRQTHPVTSEQIARYKQWLIQDRADTTVIGRGPDAFAEKYAHLRIAIDPGFEFDEQGRRVYRRKSRLKVPVSLPDRSTVE